MINLEEYEFSVGMVALVFFDNTAKWLRYNEPRLINSDGNNIGSRVKNNRGGDRKYTLREIREIAHALRRRGVIDGEGLIHCLARIDSMKNPVYKRRKELIR